MRISAAVSDLYHDDRLRARHALATSFSQQLQMKEVTAGVFRDGKLTVEGELWRQSAEASVTSATLAPDRTTTFLVDGVSPPSSPYVYDAGDRGLKVSGTNGGVMAILRGGTVHYKLALASQPHHDVVVNARIDLAPYYVGKGGVSRKSLVFVATASTQQQLVFTPETWHMEQTVVLAQSHDDTIVAGNDNLAEVDFLVTHHTSSGDVRYNTWPCSPATFEEGPLQTENVTVVAVAAAA